jgi:hypothetical protein
MTVTSLAFGTAVPCSNTATIVTDAYAPNDGIVSDAYRFALTSERVDHALFRIGADEPKRNPRLSVSVDRVLRR